MTRGSPSRLLEAVADWPVFLSSTMHHYNGDLFAVGDTMAWSVELIDGIAAGWPEHVLADVMVTIRSRPDWALRGAIADSWPNPSVLAWARATWHGTAIECRLGRGPLEPPRFPRTSPGSSATSEPSRTLGPTGMAFSRRSDRGFSRTQSARRAGRPQQDQAMTTACCARTGC